MQDTSTQPSHIQGNPDNGENANRCKNCTRSFSSKRGLNQHLHSQLVKQEESLLKN